MKQLQKVGMFLIGLMMCILIVGVNGNAQDSEPTSSATDAQQVVESSEQINEEQPATSETNESTNEEPQEPSEPEPEPEPTNEEEGKHPSTDDDNVVVVDPNGNPVVDGNHANKNDQPEKPSDDNVFKVQVKMQTGTESGKFEVDYPMNDYQPKLTVLLDGNVVTTEEPTINKDKDSLIYIFEDLPNTDKNGSYIQYRVMIDNGGPVQDPKNPELSFTQKYERTNDVSAILKLDCSDYAEISRIIYFYDDATAFKAIVPKQDSITGYLVDEQGNIVTHADFSLENDYYASFGYHKIKKKDNKDEVVKYHVKFNVSEEDKKNQIACVAGGQKFKLLYSGNQSEIKLGLDKPESSNQDPMNPRPKQEERSYIVIKKLWTNKEYKPYTPVSCRGELPVDFDLFMKRYERDAYHRVAIPVPDDAKKETLTVTFMKKGCDPEKNCSDPNKNCCIKTAELSAANGWYAVVEGIHDINDYWIYENGELIDNVGTLTIGEYEYKPAVTTKYANGFVLLNQQLGKAKKEEPTTPSIFKVEFDTQGATPIKPQYIEFGEKVIRPSNPIKDGYKFVGWMIDQKDLEDLHRIYPPRGDELVQFDFSTRITKDIKLVAKFEKLPEPKEAEKNDIVKDDVVKEEVVEKDVPQTGDTSHPELAFFLLMMALVGAKISIIKIHSSKQSN